MTNTLEKKDAHKFIKCIIKLQSTGYAIICLYQSILNWNTRQKKFVFCRISSLGYPVPSLILNEHTHDECRTQKKKKRKKKWHEFVCKRIEKIEVNEWDEYMKKTKRWNEKNKKHDSYCASICEKGAILMFFRLLYFHKLSRIDVLVTHWYTKAKLK